MFKELKDLIEGIRVASLISFDLETTSTKPLDADIVGISFSIEAHAGYYIPVEFPEKLTGIGLDLGMVLEEQGKMR